MNQQSQNNNSNKTQQQKILLDTNVFSDLHDREFGTEVISYIIDLGKRGFNFAISNITLYEILRGLKAENEAKVVKLLSEIFRYNITDEVLIASARLDNVFKMEHIEINSIDHGDKIISATAILTGSLILTANVRDFPWPYFHEIETKPIFYQSGHKTKCHVLALITPDFDHILRRFNERP